MNAKNKILILFIIGSIFCSVILSGCATIGSSSGEFSSDVIRHTKGITELKTENERLTGIIDSASDRISVIIDDSEKRLTDIRAGSSEISESIDRVIYLFGKYDKEVRRLLQEMYSLRDQMEKLNETSLDSDNSTDSNDNN